MPGGTHGRLKLSVSAAWVGVMAGDLKKLLRLDLSRNRLALLPKTVAALKNLRYINLGGSWGRSWFLV
jgi:Leucine-rich repeat (LRR) protein